MVYAMEQLQEGAWVNVGYAEFDTFEEAMDDAKGVASTFGIPWDDMRVRATNEIPPEDLDLCSCGSPLAFSNDCDKLWCDVCGEYIDRDRPDIL